MHFTFDTYLAFVGIVLGIGAIAMAVPPFVQMIWGAPEVEIYFGERHDGDTKLLNTTLENLPITNKFLRLLRVVRFPAEIIVSYSIFEDGTRRVILPRTVVTYSDGARIEYGKTQLKPPIPVAFPLLQCRQTGVIAANGDANSLSLPTGQYIVWVGVIVDGVPLTKERKMVVDSRPTSSRWVN